jgi:DNA-3-methyladenine glycosylase II
VSKLLVDVPEIKQGLLRIQSEYPQVETLCPDPLITIDRSKYDDPFTGMVRIVLGQQVSTKAAASIWAKVQDLLSDDVSPERIKQQNYDDLRNAGLSGRKVEYLQGLSQAVLDGQIDFDAMIDMKDDDVSKSITDLRGFGQWSADMFLLFGLGRGNIWADGDLGVKLGLQLLLAQEERPDDKKMQQFKDEFSPYGSAASLLMWHIKQHEK